MRRLPVPAVPRALRYAGVLAVAVAIAYFSLLDAPPQGPPGTGPWWDKRLHFAAYAALGVAVAYATIEERRLLVRAGLVLGAAGLYGTGIELVQWVLPDRYFGVGDIVANLIGGVLALSWLAAEQLFTYVPVLDWVSDKI